MGDFEDYLTSALCDVQAWRALRTTASAEQVVHAKPAIEGSDEWTTSPNEGEDEPRCERGREREREEGYSCGTVRFTKKRTEGCFCFRTG